MEFLEGEQRGVRRMDRTHGLAAGVLFALALLASLIGCEGESETQLERKLSQELESAEARLDEVKEQLVTEQSRWEGQFEEMRHRQDQERARTEAVEADFLIAAVVCFSCVLAVFLLLGLLLREHRSKKVMARFVRWLKQRGNLNGDREG